MLVSDRFLTALGEYLREVVTPTIAPRLRDWTGVKGARELVVDADDPEEHAALYGVFALDGVVSLMVRAKDLDDDERRTLMGSIYEPLTTEGETGDLAVVEWLNDTNNNRGIGTLGLQVYELRVNDGFWEVEEKWMNGKVEFAVMVSGANRAS